MSAGERFYLVREALKLSATAFGAPLGIKKSHVSGIETEKSEPSDSVIRLLISHYKVRPGWWESGEGEMFESGNPSGYKSAEQGTDEFFKKMELLMAKQSRPPADYITVPRYYVAASAGGGSTIYSEQIVDNLTFKSEWVRSTLGGSPDRLAVISVTGDSMEPFLRNNDLILIDLSACTIESNSVYVLKSDGDLIVKRVQKKVDGGVVVKSDNPAYDPESFGPESAKQLVVVGRMLKRLVD